MINLAVFVSGRGSNLKSILHEIESGKLGASVRLVVSNKTACPAFKTVRKYSIKCISVSDTYRNESYVSYNDLLDIMKAEEIDLVVLAGFLKKIPDMLVEKYPNKIINIHPALLPSFGGKGMYGKHVHEAVFNKSCQVSGATVHFVDRVYDNGKIIAQEAVDISRVESPEEIAQSVLKIEHKLLPFVINAFAENKITIKNNRVMIEK